ncbi:WhiB family transcriptional regulator [Streptomyces sp. NPDC096048]|uniref:WhiB family transcriptional regulator n=1 Tax=Streptomyces sp. NPDC096048 TaxID=3366072 RepID=UPI0038276FD2
MTPNLAWLDRAACVGMDDRVFYANGKHAREQVKAARQVCAGCPVRRQCAAFAIQTGEKWGVWGGMSQQQLRQRRRRSLPGTRGKTAA